VADDAKAPDPDRPRDESAAEPGGPLGGLKEARCVAIERVEIRTRESITARAGWRLQAASASGEGAISLIEISPTVSLYRGDGVFLGWPAERLEAAYRALLPPSDEPTFESNQLG
jgi:hypothetical protein